MTPAATNSALTFADGMAVRVPDATGFERTTISIGGMSYHTDNGSLTAENVAGADHSANAGAQSDRHIDSVEIAYCGEKLVSVCGHPEDEISVKRNPATNAHNSACRQTNRRSVRVDLRSERKTGCEKWTWSRTMHSGLGYCS
jgi:hypothetical protein